MSTSSNTLPSNSSVRNYKNYPAKLLLFGEHTLLKGSQGLAMPSTQFSGTWQQHSDGNLDAALQQWHNYLLEKQQQGRLLANLNLAPFQQAIEAGLYFKSSIPIGYGLGSSGALTAALYDTFGLEKAQDLKILKQQLGQLESYFHGTSSGMDPLICYLNTPVLITPASINTVSLPAPSEHFHLFLLDSQQPRQTGHLVNWFLAQCEDNSYFNRIEAELIPLVQEAIELLLASNWEALLENIHHISWFQFKYFEPMIPSHLRSIWLEGLSSDWFKLKLCGAGGGGFFLGITNDLPRLQQEIPFVLSLRLGS